jgi:uncharacterized repeat protein (TIGR01451 family)
MILIPFGSSRRALSSLSARLVVILSLALQAVTSAHGATLVVNSTAADRGSFTQLQCLPPGSDVDPGPAATTVTGGANLATAQADGALTLREAICVANNTPEADVIALASETYLLTGIDNYWYGPNGLPPIGDDITIEGNGAVIERSGNVQSFRFFFVSRKTLTDGIHIVGGTDRARLVLRDLTLRNGFALAGSGQAGGGGGGMGGAIFNQGQLNLERVTFEGNTAKGGDSGTGGFQSSGGGGGMGQSGGVSGGGFGPGQFGGALGGNALYEPAITALGNFSCGGGAGFGLAAGGNARILGAVVVGGDGGGLGNVGGSRIFLCFQDECGAQGRDGGAGGQGQLGDTASGSGQGGSFGRSGSTASQCAGGGGVGAGGGAGELLSGFQGGSGGFGGGGGSRPFFASSSVGLTLGGGGGFGGGGGYGDAGVASSGGGGFGAGFGAVSTPIPSGGGGAGLGGALFNHGGIVTSVNTTWTGNRAIGGSVSGDFPGQGAGYGGAIFNLDGQLTIDYSTLSGNQVIQGNGRLSGFPLLPAGGAVYNRVQNPGIYGFVSSAVIRNSILADSIDGNGLPVSDCNHSAHPDANVSSALASASFLLVETLVDVDELPNGAENIEHRKCAIGSNGLLADPQLLPLADNGGLTVTLAISPGSPAFNSAGSCTNAATDQRGVARPQGSTCDRGAVELSFHSVGGQVQGLAGSGLILRNNGGAGLPLAADGPFTFPSSQPEGAGYDVAVTSQPRLPSQTCTVSNGSGVVPRADVSDVLVSCVIDQFSAGGTVSGLAGSGLVLQNNGGDFLPIAANGGFSFSPQDDGSSYDITVAIQPTALSQTCTVQNGMGTLAGAGISNVAVVCATNSFTVGGTLSGLNGNQVVLQNNGGDDQALTANGVFSFSPQLDGGTYAITIIAQPVGPPQTCVIANDSGLLAGANVSNIEVVCTNDQQPTTTAIGVQSPTTSVVGENYTITVTVTADYESPLGLVTISEGIGSCGPVTLTPGTAPTSTASCSLSSLAAGTRTLTAQYTPASGAFGDSAGTASHVVNPAATDTVATGPDRSRINQSTRFAALVGVTAPGGGIPAGTVTLNGGTGSCQYTLPTATPGCDLNWSSLGPQSVSASFVSSDGNHLGSSSSGAGNASTLVYALADVSVSKTDGEGTFQPDGLIVYTVQVRNHGPDSAAQVGVQDLIPAGLNSVHWSCDSSGGATCMPSSGDGDLDMILPSLPVGALLNYSYFGTVDGAPAQIVNTATLILPADNTVDDPNSANNVAVDQNLMEALFADGFEAPQVQAPEGSLRLPTVDLATVLDGIARTVFVLTDRNGQAARVYARLYLGTVEYALARRGIDGRWTLGPWSAYAVEPTLSWSAQDIDGAWQLTRIDLR